MDTTRILVFTAKRGDIPVLEFRFAFIYIRTCISSLKEKKKKLHRFFEDLLTEQFEKKKGRISTYHVTRAWKKINPFAPAKRKEVTRIIETSTNKISFKLHTTYFHSMNSLHPSLLTFCARHTTKTCAR